MGELQDLPQLAALSATGGGLGAVLSRVGVRGEIVEVRSCEVGFSRIFQRRDLIGRLLRGRFYSLTDIIAGHVPRR